MDNTNLKNLKNHWLDAKLLFSLPGAKEKASAHLLPTTTSVVIPVMELTSTLMFLTNVSQVKKTTILSFSNCSVL